MLANPNDLESTGEIEYLFISIYRISFSQSNRADLMNDIIHHINNPDKIKSKVKLIHRFSTIYNNRILGLEVQNASVYGSKIQLSFDDFDKELSRTIRKNDVIIVHRINNKKLSQYDAIASAFGLSTYSPSGINEVKSYTGVGEGFKNKLTLPIQNKIEKGVNKFLSDTRPIFSGLITKPSIVLGNNIKLTIEAQDMVRIMQHINTEEKEEGKSKTPKNLDRILTGLNLGEAGDQGISLPKDDEIAIITSNILKTLSSAVVEHVKSFGNLRDFERDGNEFFDVLDTFYDDIKAKISARHSDKMFINPISNGMYLIHISPLKALKLFTNYYAKNTGINVFFDINTWDTDFIGEKKIIDEIFFNIFKDQDGTAPYFTFGLMLDFNDVNIIRTLRDKVGGTAEADNKKKLLIFKQGDLRHFFTTKTFDNIFRHRVIESYLLRAVNNNSSDNYSSLIGEFFLHLIDDGINPILKSPSENASIITVEARQSFQNKLEQIKAEFDGTLSFDYIIHTNFTSVRSVEYNSLLTNQMKSVPITQIVQLFIGAMTVIPVSQSKSTTKFENSAHNISQRIWLSSSIGFSNDSEESWVWKNGLKPTIYFGLNYEPAVQSNETTHIKDSDIVNAEMYSLPDNGGLSMYSWETKSPSIRIGYSRMSDNIEDRTSPLTLGMTNLFDMENVAGDINDYVSENTEPQIGGLGVTPISIPRVCVFKLSAVHNSRPDIALDYFDSFVDPLVTSTLVGERTVYLGYDMYGMKAGEEIRLPNSIDLKLYAPIYNTSAGAGKEGELHMVGTLDDPVENTTPEWGTSGLDFPANNRVVTGGSLTGSINLASRKIVTGIQNYHDPTKLLPILKLYKHFIKHGFTGVNGEGDKNWYNDKETFQIYHNIKIDQNSVYLDTYEVDDTTNFKTDTVDTLVTKLITWVEQFIGNDFKKRRMMVKYAKDIVSLRVGIIQGDKDKALELRVSAVQARFHYFNPANLSSSLTFSSIKNTEAIKSMRVLLGFVRSLSHYMNIVGKESTTGGVLFMALKAKSDGEIFKIGDAVTFVDPSTIDPSSITDTIKNVLKKIIIVDSPKSSLDIYKKVYYIWKATYYFGGAGTDPSGTSGNTARLYITDSGIHWKSSYEESDITTNIAESMQLQRLGVNK